MGLAGSGSRGVNIIGVAHPPRCVSGGATPAAGVPAPDNKKSLRLNHPPAAPSALPAMSGDSPEPAGAERHPSVILSSTKALVRAGHARVQSQGHRPEGAGQAAIFPARRPGAARDPGAEGPGQLSAEQARPGLSPDEAPRGSPPKGGDGGLPAAPLVTSAGDRGAMVTQVSELKSALPLILATPSKGEQVPPPTTHVLWVERLAFHFIKRF